jgi:glycosyltransferase involved in cell wall biosynthesis
MPHPEPINGLSVILPAWNEADNLPAIIKTLQDLLQNLVDIEIIVVNDGSTDQTAAVLKKLSSRYPDLQWVTLKENKGYGAAIQAGLSRAQKDFIFITDADGQIDCTPLPGLIKDHQGWDIVIGQRKHRQDPVYRIWYGKAWNILCRLLFKIKLNDVDCAFKLIRKASLQGGPFLSSGALISVELVCRILQNHGTIKEITVNHYPRRYGKPTGGSWKVIYRAFREMVHLYPLLKRKSQ